MSTFNHKINLPGRDETPGTGWLPPVPDLRDYTADHKQIREIIKNMKHETSNLKQPGTVDLRKWCSPVENQGSLGSCTAHAGIGVIEYFQNRSFGKHTGGSRLFLYKTTRNLMQTTGDAGAWLRSTMGAIVLCGVPPEKYMPYKIADFDNEPSAFLYSVAENFEAVKYFCHDPVGAKVEGSKLLESVKKYLIAGIPSMFGFWGFPSYNDSNIPGAIPYPSPGETAQWGHAVVAAGFDDSLKIVSTKTNSETTGALLIRNSWGPSWGDKGYGWLPYQYVLTGLALDFWSILSMEWIDSGQFGI